MSTREAEAQEQEEKEEQEIRVQVPFLITESGIAEETWDRKNAPLFVIRKFGSDEIKYVGEIETEQVDAKGRRIIYVPCDNPHLRKGLVLVPERAEPSSFEEVFSEGYELVKEMYDFSQEKEQEIKLLCAIAQASWFLDRMMPQQLQLAGIGVYAPIIAIRGRSGSGKNRLLNALRLQSYRPFYDQTTVRIPSIYRPLDLWRGTLCLDEADVQGTETNELVKLLNCRATGTPISRQNPDQPKISEAFFNFGLTIVTQRRAWQDDALENRSVPFYSEKSQKELETVELDDWIRKGVAIQNKLLYLRLLYWDQVAIDKSARITGVRDHRLTASVLPLLALAKYAPSIVENLAEILQELERKRKEVRAQSADGVIVNLLWDYLERGLVGTWNAFTYIGKEKVKQDKEEIVIPLSTSEIAEQLAWKSKQVRSTIHSLQLGDGPSKIRLGGRIFRPIFFTYQTLEPLLIDFVVDYEAGALERILKTNGISVADVAHVADYISVAFSEKDKKKEKPTEIKSATPATSATKEGEELDSNIADNPSLSRQTTPTTPISPTTPTEGGGVTFVTRQVPDLPGLRASELCPPWLTTAQWDKLDHKERLAAWAKIPRKEEEA